MQKRAEEIKRAREEARREREAEEEKERTRAAAEAGAGGMPGFGGMPGGGMPGGMTGLAGLMNDPEIQAGLSNPKVMKVFQDLMGGPGGPMAAKSNPGKLAAAGEFRGWAAWGDRAWAGRAEAAGGSPTRCPTSTRPTRPTCPTSWTGREGTVLVALDMILFQEENHSTPLTER
ncbi:hypothetical protein ACHAWF_004329 [Thalassiosira exigua]